MRNANITGADRATYLKVVGVSLAASILVLAVSIALRTVPSDAGSQTAHGPVIKASKTIVTTTTIVVP